MDVVLPSQLIARVRRGHAVIEVGAGARWGTALQLSEAAPGVELRVMDRDTCVLAAPRKLRPFVDDVTRPILGLYGAPDLIYAVRLPEEVQPACARLARALGADLGLRALKDEWADVSSEFRTHVVWPGGWRYYANGASPRG